MSWLRRLRRKSRSPVIPSEARNLSVGLTAGAASFASCAKGADLDPSDMTETSTHVFKRDVHKCRVPHPLRFVQRVRICVNPLSLHGFCR